MTIPDRTHPAPPIYVVSGGNGAAGEQVVFTVLAQYPGAEVDVITIDHVAEREEVERIVERAASDGGTIVHSLVDRDLHDVLVALANRRFVNQVDLMGDLMRFLDEHLSIEPLGVPGLYRRQHLDEFERIESIHFSLGHDDGLRIEELHLADIVLAGLSRVGKTPLSMYLAVLGWKTANVPVVPQVALPGALFEIDPRRVFGLTIEPDQLLDYRKTRQRELGYSHNNNNSYVDSSQIFTDVEDAERLFKRSRFATLNVTRKPLETTANQIIRIMRRRFGDEAHRPVRTTGVPGR